MQVYVVYDCTSDTGPIGVARTREQAIEMGRSYMREMFGKRVSIRSEDITTDSGKLFTNLSCFYLGETEIVVVEGFELA